MSTKSLFIAATIILISIFVAAGLFYQNQQSAEENTLVSNNATALERKGAAVKGPAEAKVTIVEFFDPACGTCAQFYPLVQHFIDQYPGKVKVMMRYAPLHQGSDQVVKLLEAAHLQGKFWPALELLFANQQYWVANHVSQADRAQAVLNSLGLDQMQFATDFNGMAVADAIQEDVMDGKILSVRATPEFFVNGKAMPDFGFEQLKQLVENAVAEAY